MSSNRNLIEFAAPCDIRRLSDRLSNFVGGWYFIIAFGLFLVAWTGINRMGAGGENLNAEREALAKLQAHAKAHIEAKE